MFIIFFMFFCHILIIYLFVFIYFYFVQIWFLEYIMDPESPPLKSNTVKSVVMLVFRFLF